MIINIPVSSLRSLSALSVNLSAGWFGAALITPAFITQPFWPMILTSYVATGMLFLMLSMKIEHMIDTL